MKLFYPEIFDKFICTGSQCSDNCCMTDWDIEIDDGTYGFYKKLDNDIGRKFLNSVTEEDGVKYLVHCDGKCPMLNEKGLCSVQLAYGEENISDICREHPRFYEWFGDYKEAGVGLACEEAVRMYLSDAEPVRFFTKEISEEPDDLEFDPELLEIMLFARKAFIDLLQNREISLHDRLTNVLSAAAEIQAALDDEDIEDIKAIAEELYDPEIIAERAKSLEKAVPEKPLAAAENMLFYLEHLDFIGDILPQQIKDASRFVKKLSAPVKAQAKGEYEKLAVYFVYRYFLKAVRDFDLLSKIKAMLVFVFAAEVINVSREQDTAARFETVKELCKEIEYSSDNMDRIYDDSYLSGCFSDAAMLTLLKWSD